MSWQDGHISMNNLTTNHTSNSHEVILPGTIEFGPKRWTESHQIRRWTLIYNNEGIKDRPLFELRLVLLFRTVYFTFQDRIFYFSGLYILLFRTVYFTSKLILLFRTVYFTFQNRIFYFSGLYIIDYRPRV